jgi:hypothetical protein
LLTQKSLNHFQNWALSYHYMMRRRTEMEDLDVQLERECFNLAPDRWTQVYRDRILGTIDADDGGIPLTADDLDNLDRYMEEQERAFKQELQLQQVLGTKRTMSGAQSSVDNRVTQQATPLSWGPWK